MLDSLNIYCEHRSTNPAEFLTVLEQIEEVMKPDPPMPTPNLFFENESNAVSYFGSNASLESYSSPNVSSHTHSIKTEASENSNEGQLCAPMLRHSQGSIGQNVISPVTQPVTQLQTDAAQQVASYIEQQQQAAFAQQVDAYMQQQQQQAAFAQSVASYMHQQKQFAVPPKFAVSIPPQQAAFPSQFAAPVLQQQAAFQSQFVAPVPVPIVFLGTPVPVGAPFLSGAQNDAPVPLPVCSSWPPFKAPMPQPVGAWCLPPRAPMPQPVGAWCSPPRSPMPQPVGSTCPPPWAPQHIRGSEYKRHGTSSDSGFTSTSMRTKASKSTPSNSNMSDISGASISIPQEIMNSLNEGTQLLLSLEEPPGNLENRGSNFSVYLTDALMDRRPCKLIQLMREVLTRCGSTKNDNPQLRKAKCGNKLEHLVFICLLASELEHLWATTCYWAHDESLDNSMLTSVYIHPEFYKRSIDINANPKLKILPLMFIRVFLMLYKLRVEY